MQEYLQSENEKRMKTLLEQENTKAKEKRVRFKAI